MATDATNDDVPVNADHVPHQAANGTHLNGETKTNGINGTYGTNGSTETQKKVGQGDFFDGELQLTVLRVLYLNLNTMAISRMT
jgi:hypothetical protein